MENQINLSSKHHYLPKFYLKGFTNSDGQFAIFDYSKNRLKKNMHNPTGHFFINDRNTIDAKGQKTDLLEHFYSKMDDKYTTLIADIQNLKNATTTEKEMTLLIEFVSFLFWRLPVNDKLFENEYNNNPIFKYIFKIKDIKTGEEAPSDISKAILETEAVMKGAKAFASSISLDAAPLSVNNGSWGLTYSKDGLKLCSDNPIIFKTANAKDIFSDDFIFPVTKTHLLTRSLKVIELKELPPEFSMYVDLLIFKQGNIYCCSARKDYLETISQFAPHYELENLKRKVFSYLS